MPLKLELIQSLALATKEALFFEAKQCDGKRTGSHYIFAFRLFFCHNSIQGHPTSIFGIYLFGGRFEI